MAEEFVHLHLHTHSSDFDGLGTEKEFVERAAEMGQPAMAVTDHGTLRGLHAAQKACDDAKIKLIPGVEAYLADDAEQKGLTKEERTEIAARYASKSEAEVEIKALEGKRRDRDHITIWAMNEAGVRSLYRLMTWAWTKGFYYKSRVDLARLKEFNEGLLVSTGCPTGIISSPLRAGHAQEAVTRMEALASIFGDRLYVEIMPHRAEGVSVASQLLRLAEAFGCQTIATQDAHYPVAADADSQEVLLAIQTRARMSDPDRFCFSTRNFWARSRIEMEAAFAKDCPEVPRKAIRAALDETVLFAERCSARVLAASAGTYLAAPKIPEGFIDYDDWLAALCARAVPACFGGEGLSQEYFARLIHELDVIEERGVAPYFLAVWDAVEWMRRQEILCSPRGSAAGCLVSYLLGVTHLDPVKYNLSFERFLSPGRKDLPDIDLDVQGARRQEVLDYLREAYGEDRVAQITAFGRFGAKSLIHDVARVFELPRDRSETVAKMLDRGGDEGSGEEETESSSLASALTATDIGKAFLQEYRREVDLVARFQDQLRSVGVHAAGVVISSRPLADVVPVETRGRGSGRIPVVAFDMYGAEASGLVKMDILGLKTLDILHHAMQAVGVSFDAIDYSDLKVIEAFNARRFAGVFQFDSGSARRLARGYRFTTFGSIADFTALDRPGPLRSGLADEYVRRQNALAKVVLLHPVYDEITRETLGVLIYQEQIVALAERLAGYTSQAAQVLRKKIGKKLGAEDEREAFVAGLVRGGMGEEPAINLFEQAARFAEYAFCRAHAYVYAATAFRCQWLRVHHFPQFVAAMLAFEADVAKQEQIAAEARHNGVAVVPPDVTRPHVGFVAEQDAGGRWEVSGSIADVKGVGDVATRAIVRAAPFSSLTDFRRRLVGERVTVAQFEALAKATAFRKIFPHHRVLAVNARRVWQDAGVGVEWKLDERVSGVSDYSPAEAAVVAATAYPLYSGLDGKTGLDLMEEEVLSGATREVLSPGEFAGGFGIYQSACVLARVADIKEYTNSSGRKVARLTLVGVDGMQAQAKAYEDVLDACPCLEKGEAVLAVLYSMMDGNAFVEWAVRATEAKADEAAIWMLRPSRTRPRDPAKAMVKAGADSTFAVQGRILRMREHRDSRGSRMATVGLAGEAGYVRFFAFARTWTPASESVLQPGAFVRVSLRKVDANAAALVTDRSASIMRPDGV